MTDEQQLIKELRHIETLEQLEAALGELTPEEKQLVEAMSEPPTEEELAEFKRAHPDFTQHVLARLRERHPEMFPRQP